MITRPQNTRLTLHVIKSFDDFEIFERSETGSETGPSDRGLA